MLPFYLHVCEHLKWEVNNSLLEKMKGENENKLKQLEANLQDAIKNLGESEVRDAMQAKAAFFTKIGDKVEDQFKLTRYQENAISQYRLTSEKTVGSGQKLDIVFTLIRIGLFWMDHDLITRNIEKAKRCL